MRKTSVGRICYPKIALRNFCACTQKVSTSLLRICVYAQKIQEMTIIVQISLNNPIVDDLHPAQNSRYGIRTMYIAGPCFVYTATGLT